ncbi:hypothetical protein DERP_011511 [Dermatophagoides pteronyssinus]|uniref:Uncharacterized protein n=1 Tax=Dermatophagoides pteronyssinus TaxID=6956 RepID=A0ABQ8JCN2_DERPT|nr:hypothetical protein DERP_011511 [Dermatophagoides pteronyssinus]
MWIVFVFSRFLFMLVWFGKFNVFTILELIWRVFFLRPNYRHNSYMINVDRICIFKILVWFGKFNVFNILELIWSVFYLRPNYRHYSDMINVDRICIFEIPDHVRFGLINLMFSQFMKIFGAFSYFKQIIETILI